MSAKTLASDGTRLITDLQHSLLWHKSNLEPLKTHSNENTHTDLLHM